MDKGIAVLRVGIVGIALAGGSATVAFAQTEAAEQPGQKAAKNLHWGAVPDGTESTTGPCEPESAGLNVIPPDEKQPFAVKANLGSVCEHGTIDGSAYHRA